MKRQQATMSSPERGQLSAPRPANKVRRENICIAFVEKSNTQERCYCTTGTSHAPPCTLSTLSLALTGVSN